MKRLLTIVTAAVIVAFLSWWLLVDKPIQIRDKNGVIIEYKE